MSSKRERALQLVVVDDAAFFQVHEQHLARLQAPLLDDPRLRNVEHADLRRHDDQIVVGDDEPRRTQAVAVERGTDLPAVGERHRRRAVPRLHQRGVVLVERAPILVHQRIAGPRLGNHHHHRVGEWIATHDQQLERVVERGRVRLSVVDQRPQLRQVVAQHLRRDRAFACAYPVEVAAQRVDFAVVGNEAERMGQVPRGERVGREPLVDHRQRRHHRCVVQVGVVLADLLREEHALVRYRARRERRHIKLAAVPQVQRLDRVTCALSYDVELALERILVHVAGTTRDEDLPDHRFDFLGAQREAAVVGGHVAPAEQQLAFGLDRTLDFLFAGHAGRRLLRQEDHADAILADCRQRDAELAAGAAEEEVGQLDQDARAVALQRVGAGRAAVGQVLEDPQAMLDDRMVLPALDVGNEP
jgi:hypothetical protein